MTIRYSLILILLVLFGIGCSKENTRPMSLAEIIIGQWQLKESVEPGTYGDANWHEPNNPELNEVCFRRDSSVLFKHGEFAERLGKYHVIENDTIYFTVNWDFIWTVIDFNENELTVSLGTSPEGETKRKFTKIN